MNRLHLSLRVISALVGVSAPLSTKAFAHQATLRAAGPCAPLGSIAQIDRPPSVPATAVWAVVSAFAQGALQGAAAPGLVEAFRTSPPDSWSACFEVLPRGKVGPVVFLEFRASIGDGREPLLLRGADFALGPDSAIFALGEDREVISASGSVPQISRLNAVLVRYHLAGAGRTGPEERLQVARVLFGVGGPGVLEYQECEDSPVAVMATFNRTTGYRSETYVLFFGADGTVARVEQHDGLVKRC